MKKKVRIIIGIAIGMFVLYTFYFLWEQSQPAPVVYELLKTSKRDIIQHSTAAGQIEARRQVNIKPRITGILKDLCVNVGEVVKVGDVIAKVEIIPDMNSLNEAKSAVEEARLRLDEIQREYNRIHSLFNKGVVSKEEYEQKENELHLAKEALTKAHSTEEIVLTGSSSRTGKVNTTVITATMAGVVIDLPLKVGASVVATSMFSDGTTIATIADMSSLRFTGKIDETEVEKLNVGMPVELIIGAMKEHRLTGTIEEIASMGNKDNGTVMFEIKASVNTTENLTVSRAGYSATARMTTERRENVLTIDEAAVEFEGNQAYVYVLTSDSEDLNHQHFERKPVKLGISDGIYMEIVSGITVNDILKGNKK